MDIYKNVRIIDTAFGGYGVAKVDGNYTVFVPFTVEGDIVNFEIVQKKKTYAFAKVLKIIEKSPLRTEQHCPYIEKCGGCTFGFIKYENQIKIKEKIVKNFFRNFDNFKIDKIIISPKERYRFRAKFRILNKNFGFLKFKSNDFIPINDCIICKKSIIEKISEISKHYKNNSLAQFYIIENEEDEALIYINRKIELKDFNIPKILGIRTENNIIGEDFLKINYNEGYYFVSFDTFSQSNRFLIKDFNRVATENLTKNDNVLELYSGAGFFTYKISEKSNSVLTIEEDTTAIELLKKLKLKNVKTKSMNIIKIKNFKNFSKFNVIFLDPPRQGASKNIIKMIEKLKFEKIIYVSCNPATLSRDINFLKKTYIIEKFYIIDMFPNTHHIETICMLKRG